jgi:Zn-dependent peptidase ImmA (M78 family)
MIYRCKDLGLITESKYTSLFKQMSMKRMRVKEPLDDIIPVPEPVVLRKSIQMIIEKNVKNALQIIHESGVPQEYIEMLCNLDDGSLNVKEPEATIKLVINPLI